MYLFSTVLQVTTNCNFESRPSSSRHQKFHFHSDLPVLTLLDLFTFKKNYIFLFCVATSSSNFKSMVFSFETSSINFLIFLVFHEVLGINRIRFIPRKKFTDRDQNFKRGVLATLFDLALFSSGSGVPGGEVKPRGVGDARAAGSAGLSWLWAAASPASSLVFRSLNEVCCSCPSSLVSLT